MANTGHLTNIHCPECGQKSEFYISINVDVLVEDTSTHVCTSIDWFPESPIQCMHCGCTGTVKEFTFE